jgi:hypothetical protein
MDAEPFALLYALLSGQPTCSKLEESYRRWRQATRRLTTERTGDDREADWTFFLESDGAEHVLGRVVREEHSVFGTFRAWFAYPEGVRLASGLPDELFGTATKDEAIEVLLRGWWLGQKGWRGERIRKALTDKEPEHRGRWVIGGPRRAEGEARRGR